MVTTGSGKAITRYRNARLIYNPCAGAFRRRGEERLSATLAALRAAGHAVEIEPTTGPGAAADMARALVKRGADLILVAGGDGTINETLNGMAGSAVPLGVLPAGTANVLGHEIGLARNMVRVAGRIGEFEPLPVALGVLHCADAPPRRFLMMAGAGLDARVVTEMDPALKRRLGKFAYWVVGMRLAGKQLAQLDARAGQVSRRCGFALAARVRNYGGDLEIARRASLLRDDFAIVLMEGDRATSYLKYLAGAVTDTLGRMRGATLVDSEKVELSPVDGAEVFMQVDGELAGKLPATLHVEREALNLLVPPEYLARERRRTR